MTVSEAFAIAVQHHQSRRLAEAEAIYRQILAADPRHAEALHLLGVIAHQVGRNDVAVEMILKAIALVPDAPAFHSNLGEAYRKLGRLDDAIAAFRRAIQLRPDSAEPYNNLGTALAGQGRPDEAITAYRRAIGLKADYAEPHCNLGNVLKEQGRPDEALAAYRRAIEIRPNYAQAHSSLGSALAKRDELDEAISAYHRALEIDPAFAEAHYNLGNAFKDQGQLAGAVAAYRRAIEFQPEYAEAHNNLGNVLKEQGRIEEAITAFRRALQLKSEFAETHNNLGIALHDHAQIEEAMAAYRRAVELQPDFAEAHNNLAIALQDHGQPDEALAACRRAIKLQPDYAKAHNSLGNVLNGQGQLDDAVAAYHRAIEIQPDFAEAHTNVGNVLTEQGRLDEAVAAHRRALQFRPDFPEALRNLGNVLRDLGRLDEAIAACRQAIKLRPDYADAHSSLGAALSENGQLDDATSAFRHSIQLRPDYAEAHNNLGNALKEQARLDEAMESYRRAVALKPQDAVLRSNPVYTALFHPGYDARALREESARWQQAHEVPLQRCIQPHTNTRDPGRRLKVGYVSPDFRHHVICHFLTPLLESHDHAGFEIYCYANVKRPDAITDRMKRTADVWRDALGLPDQALAEMIREDGIDILVDLTQHMADNRLPVFARKPAPVQLAWLGYPGSTGLQAMDYRLTDARMEPEGSAWSESVEKPLRLPDSWFCFDPIDEFPEPGKLPALRAGHVTFGCLNNFCKVSDAVLERWAGVLWAVADSRLLLRCPEGGTQARIRGFFEARGIASERIELVGWLPTRAAFLDLFQRMDIALDPFPYNGGTTTCDALWMGMPVLTSPGSQVVSRIGLSILSAAGMPEFIADSEADYVRLAVSLAADLPRLAQLRATLRERMKSSPFMDAPRFARNVEHAYREMWRAWCAKPCSNPTS